MPQNQGSNLGNTDDQPNVEATSKSYWFKKPKRYLTPDPDWNARKSVDFRLPQTWISKIAQAEKPPLSFDELTNTIDFSTYVMNHLKIDKLTQEHLPMIEYDVWGNFTQCPKMTMVHDSQATGYVASLSSKKLSNLERDVIFDLGVALGMFTRRIVILKWIEDLQLGVESYQKKLNITKPETFRSDISKRTPYTAYSNPQGIIYVDKYKRNSTVHHDIAPPEDGYIQREDGELPVLEVLNIFGYRCTYAGGAFLKVKPSSYPIVHKCMVPRAVLMKTGLKTVNNARPVNTVRSVNTARPFSTARSFNTVRPSYTAYPKSPVHCARPRTHFQNQAQSTVQRPLYKKTALTNRSHNQNVNTGIQTVNTGRQNVNCNTPKMGRSGIWVGECYFIDQQHEIRERPLYESFKIDTLD
ncbi:hypothetical protein Tco_0943178 [Tanacetum coccineum]